MKDILLWAILCMLPLAVGAQSITGYVDPAFSETASKVGASLDVISMHLHEKIDQKKAERKKAKEAKEAKDKEEARKKLFSQDLAAYESFQFVDKKWPQAQWLAYVPQGVYFYVKEKKYEWTDPSLYIRLRDGSEHLVLQNGEVRDVPEMFADRENVISSRRVALQEAGFSEDVVERAAQAGYNLDIFSACYTVRVPHKASFKYVDKLLVITQYIQSGFQLHLTALVNGKQEQEWEGFALSPVLCRDRKGNSKDPVFSSYTQRPLSAC